MRMGVFDAREVANVSKLGQTRRNCVVVRRSGAMRVERNLLFGRALLSQAGFVERWHDRGPFSGENDE